MQFAEKKTSLSKKHNKQFAKEATVENGYQQILAKEFAKTCFI